MFRPFSLHPWKKGRKRGKQKQISIKIKNKMSNNLYELINSPIIEIPDAHIQSNLENKETNESKMIDVIYQLYEIIELPNEIIPWIDPNHRSEFESQNITLCKLSLSVGELLCTVFDRIVNTLKMNIITVIPENVIRFIKYYEIQLDTNQEYKPSIYRDDFFKCCQSAGIMWWTIIDLLKREELHLERKGVTTKPTLKLIRAIYAAYSHVQNQPHLDTLFTGWSSANFIIDLHNLWLSKRVVKFDNMRVSLRNATELYAGVVLEPTLSFSAVPSQLTVFAVEQVPLPQPHFYRDPSS